MVFSSIFSGNIIWCRNYHSVYKHQDMNHTKIASSVYNVTAKIGCFEMLRKVSLKALDQTYWSGDLTNWQVAKGHSLRLCINPVIFVC